MTRKPESLEGQLKHGPAEGHRKRLRATIQKSKLEPSSRTQRTENGRGPNDREVERRPCLLRVRKQAPPDLQWITL